MPGFLLHLGATVTCAHEGQALPMVTNERVLVGGLPTVVQTTPYSVAGCTFPPPPVSNGPCISAQWIIGAIRVRSNGMPVLLQDSQALCTPTGTPLIVVDTQVRVKGM